MFILFYIGGSNTRIGVSHDGETTHAHESFPTPQGFDDAMWVMGETAARMTENAPIERAIGGFAGALDRTHTRVVHAPNLPGWDGAMLRDRLAETFSTQIVLENDAALVGLGEAVSGAGKGYNIVAFLTISSGVGGARIVDGTIDRSAYGFEPGQMIIDLDRSIMSKAVGFRAEGLLAGSAVSREYGMRPFEVHDPRLWEKLAAYCAVLVHNTIVMWSPDVVVLGGPMVTGSPAIDISRVKAHVDELLEIFPEAPPIVQASISQVGGLYGALALPKRARQGMI
jgi:predicted NBD/HSP70 family sugar kinase